jgi:hypothetical protein
MSRNLDDTNVKDKVIEKYGQQVGEKLYQVLKELEKETEANVRTRFEQAVKEELGEDAAKKIDYGLLGQWISLGG